MCEYSCQSVSNDTGLQDCVCFYVCECNILFTVTNQQTVYCIYVCGIVNFTEEKTWTYMKINRSKTDIGAMSYRHISETLSYSELFMDDLSLNLVCFEKTKFEWNLS